MVKRLPDSLDRTFPALSDPTRRRILEQLADGDQCVTEIAEPHAISLPAISKHLTVLERAGLVRRHRRGRIHRLSLESKPMQEASDWMAGYRRFWEQRFDSLEDYLNNPTAEPPDSP